MSDDVVEFFEELGRRGHEPLLAKVTGRVRFELVDGGGTTDRWLVAVDKGDTVVSHQGGPAACTIQAERVLFEPRCCAAHWCAPVMSSCCSRSSGSFPGHRANGRQCPARRAHDDRKPGQDP